MCNYIDKFHRNSVEGKNLDTKCNTVKIVFTKISKTGKPK